MKKATLLFIGIVMMFVSNRLHAATTIITVAQNGKADFSTIQAAINSIDVHHTQAIVIKISAGVYSEKIFIKKSNFTLQGAGINKTIITQSIARDLWRLMVLFAMPTAVALSQCIGILGWGCSRFFRVVLNIIPSWQFINNALSSASAADATTHLKIEHNV